MSIDKFDMQTFLRALTGGVERGDAEYIRFRDIEVDIGGKDISQEIAINVEVGYQSDTVYMEVELEGEHEVDVTLSHAQILERLDDDDEVAEFTGSVLGELDHEQAIQAVHAIAAWRMSLTAGDDDEKSISKHRRWEHIHTAITRMELPEPEPSEASGDVPDPDVSMTATELVEDAMDQRALAQERADDRVTLTLDRTPHTLGGLTRGTRFWISSQSTHALHYDERVPATTWGENMTDDTEVWITELHYGLEADLAATEDTVVTPDDLSSARSLAMAMIRNDHQRPLLIGLLVESGYAVGKKVS